MNARPELDCEAVDELAAAFALGAVNRDEERAVSAHLATCGQAHSDAHSLIGAGMVVPASLDPVVPSDGLRTRLMATIAETPQEHRTRAVVQAPPEPVEPRRSWWQLSPLPSALAAVALAAAVGLGAWGVSLNEQLADRDAALAAIASADAVHPIAGEAGSAVLVEVDDSALFVAEDLAELPDDQLYQFWLIDADGNALPAGTLDDTDGVVLSPLDQEVGAAVTFAVTLERTPVDAPTSAPVLAGEIGT